MKAQLSGSPAWGTNAPKQFVLTCEESTEKLEPVCRRVLEPVPKMWYMDRGCCSVQGPTAMEALSQLRVDNGMVVCLDIFHWIHRFDTAIRTDPHSKYAVFKSDSWGSAGIQPHRPGAAHQG